MSDTSESRLNVFKMAQDASGDEMGGGERLSPTSPRQKVVVATHNAGKVRELEGLLTPTGWELTTASAAGLGQPVELTAEQGGTFVSNALLKAEAACAASGGWALADDSGLCVAALGGLPGVDTAHYGGWEKLLSAMVGIDDRQATFVSVLALARPGKPTLTFRGEVDGLLAREGRGEGGFGYDPVFIPAGEQCTFAEMGVGGKAAFSHRARAAAALLAWWDSHK